MLRDDDVGLADPLGLLVVVVLAIDEHHDVSILLQLSAFTQVGQHRDGWIAALDGARQLRDRDDRDA